MRNVLPLVAASVVALALAGCAADPPPPAAPSRAEVGDVAPVFTLTGTGPAPGTFALGDHAGKSSVVIIFYRGGWCPYCRAQLERMEKRRAEFEAKNARLVAISVDSLAASRQLSEKLGLGFPVLADEAAKVIRAYGVIEPDRRIAIPAIVAVDRDGIVCWRRVSETVSDRPEEDEVLDKVSRLPGATR